MLSVFYQINHLQRENKVSYDVWHISEVTEYYEIRQDYVQWSMDLSVGFVNQFVEIP
jgi:hypothetical protein